MYQVVVILPDVQNNNLQDIWKGMKIYPEEPGLIFYIQRRRLSTRRSALINLYATSAGLHPQHVITYERRIILK